MDTIRPGQGDWGAVITFSMKKRDNTALDISTASSLKAHVTKPDGTTPTALDGSMVGDGTAGQFTVTITNGLFDLAGEYRMEPEVVYATAEFVGTPYVFSVRSSAR